MSGCVHVCVVRRNAALVLVSAFPLQNPEAPQRDADTLMQRQFDALRDLLADGDVSVRVVAVQV